jgi:hypothetical protein
VCKHAADLRTAEDDLATLRERLARVARFIHNDAIAYGIRANLAHDLGLPQPKRP